MPLPTLPTAPADGLTDLRAAILAWAMRSRVHRALFAQIAAALLSLIDSLTALMGKWRAGLLPPAPPARPRSPRRMTATRTLTPKPRPAARKRIAVRPSPVQPAAIRLPVAYGTPPARPIPAPGRTPTPPGAKNSPPATPPTHAHFITLS